MESDLKEKRAEKRKSKVETWKEIVIKMYIIQKKSISEQKEPKQKEPEKIMEGLIKRMNS